MSNDFAPGGKDLSILHLYDEWPVAIQATKIDAHPFPWEQPADCQRLKTSLGVPLLLAIDGNAVLGGYVRKRWEGSNPVGIRVDPPREACSHYSVHYLATIFSAKTQFSRQLGVVGSYPCLHHPGHDVDEALLKYG